MPKTNILLHAFSNDLIRHEVPRGVLQHLVGEENGKASITMGVIGFQENQGPGKIEITWSALPPVPGRLWSQDLLWNWSSSACEP